MEGPGRQCRACAQLQGDRERAQPGRRAPGWWPRPPSVTAQVFRAFCTVSVSASSALLCGAHVSPLMIFSVFRRLPAHLSLGEAGRVPPYALIL